MVRIKNVGQLRKLLENFEDNWNIELNLVSETNDKNCLLPIAYDEIEIENEVIDVGYSDRVVCLNCYKKEV